MNTSTFEILPAARGRAIFVSSGSSLVIENTHGTQVIDFWAFNAADHGEYLSMDHLRSKHSKLSPEAGDALYSNRRRALMTMTEDSSPGIHDTLLCPCNSTLYTELGCHPQHRSCEGNFFEALSDYGIEPHFLPASLNLFMNVAVDVQRRIVRNVPKSKPGDHVTLRAELDVIAVMSSCPQDVTSINGEDCKPRDVKFLIT